jgi:Fic family protein
VAELTHEVEMAIKAASGCLHGSPYSFPIDDAGLMRMKEIGEALINIKAKLDHLKELDNLPKPLRRILKTREVYESNAIEGLGPDLATTSQIIDSTQNENREVSQFVEWAITQGIKNDKHAYDVIGLTAARELSRDFAINIERPISESDIRTLNGIILKGQPRAGIYKPYANEIQGNSAHRTALPTDTPAAMEEFCNWMNSLSRKGLQTLDSIIKAAAVHAWIAHIHPFDDGNGRIARLLANMVLAREGMPPLILRNKNDRERYINALAFSDEAGDLSRLILVFCRSIERIIDVLSDPAIAEEYFKADIDLRLSGDYRVWKAAIDEWTQEALAQIRLSNLTAEKVGELQPSDFKQIRNGKAASNAWYMMVKNREDQVVALWFFGYPPGFVMTKIEKDEIFPALFCLVPDDSPNPVRPFRAPRETNRGLVTAIMVEPTSRKTYVWGDSRQLVPLKKVDFRNSAVSFARTCMDFALDPVKFHDSAY